jgi:hypothetical protein
MFTSSLNYTQWIAGLLAMARDQNFPHMARAARALLHEEGLGQCDHVDDGFECRDTATVYDIETEREFCPRHLQREAR